MSRFYRIIIDRKKKETHKNAPQHLKLAPNINMNIYIILYKLQPFIPKNFQYKRQTLSRFNRIQECTAPETGTKYQYEYNPVQTPILYSQKFSIEETDLETDFVEIRSKIEGKEEEEKAVSFLVPQYRIYWIMIKPRARITPSARQ